jgi:hypothetical protein
VNPRFLELVKKQQERKKEVEKLVATYDFPTPEEILQ